MRGIAGNCFEASCVHVAPIGHSGRLHPVGGMTPRQQLSLYGTHASKERKQFRARVRGARRESESRCQVSVNPQHTEIGKSGHDESQYRRLHLIQARCVIERDRGLGKKPPVGSGERSFALDSSSFRQMRPVGNSRGEASCA
jgi:hypothetical protein